MKTDTTKATAEAAEATLFPWEDWFDPLEAGMRTCIRGFIEELLEAELDAALARNRYKRLSLAETEAVAKAYETVGYRHGHHVRGLIGTVGPMTVRVPRGRRNPGWQDGQGEERGHSGLPTAQQTGRRADRRRLFCRDRHAASCARRSRLCPAAPWGPSAGSGDTVSRAKQAKRFGARRSLLE